VTIQNSEIKDWGFEFEGLSTPLILDAKLESLFMYDSSVGSVYSSEIHSLYPKGQSETHVCNCTLDNCYFNDPDSKVYVYWYLDVHVVDSTNQGVPSANVVVQYPNTTMAKTGDTDTQGCVCLELMEKMMNITGNYTIGAYGITATYNIYANQTTVDMIESKQITLRLTDLVVPEFPSHLILPLYMIAVLLATMVYRKNRKTVHKRSTCIDR
jgi:hypothetical protein